MPGVAQSRIPSAGTARNREARIDTTMLAWVLGLTAAFEAVTCLFRWGLGLQSTRDTAFLAPFTLRLRIHHGYIGAVAAAAIPLLPPGVETAWLLRIGLALLVSDLIHHFIVLKATTGDPQFHLTYPRTGWVFTDDVPGDNFPSWRR